MLRLNNAYIGAGLIKDQRIGMIGIGLMGLGIASNLQKHGAQINFLQHAGNQPVEELLAQGASTMNSAAEVARHSEVIILCVTGTAQVEEVLFSPQGVLSGLSQGKVVIDCSTSIPSSTQQIAPKIAQAGAFFLDAPMTRTPREAMQGKLNLIVGGDRSVFDQMQTLLSCFAENITYAGSIGSGHTLKLLHNFVSIGFATILSEAAACARKAGVDSEVLVDVLAKGGGGGVILDRLRPFITDQDDSSFLFSIANSLKDMEYYHTMAQDLQASNRAIKAVLEILQGAHSRSADNTPLPNLISILGEIS